MRRKYKIILVALLMLIGLSACDKDAGETAAKISTPTVRNESQAQAPQSENSNSQILVAYFSRTRNTKTLAEYAAEYCSADIYEIKAKVPYTDDDIDYNNSGSRANREQNDKSSRPEIAGMLTNMAQYNTIILAYPIWWGQAPRIIDTFLEQYDFSGKTIIPFCTSGSSDIGTSDDYLHALVDDTVKWADGRRFAAGTSKETLTEWLSQVYPEQQSVKNEEVNMKLYINGMQIPVTWEYNDSVKALKEEAAKGDITVAMSMYSDNEQVGSLGKSYPSKNTQTTTQNGDIVLYNGSNIVVFYGSNSWSYTRLGKINLSKSEVTALLSNGDVQLKLVK